MNGADCTSVPGRARLAAQSTHASSRKHEATSRLQVAAAIFTALVHCGAAQNSAPIITCTATRQMSIDLTVCAGDGGAPGGFAVEWALLPDASDAKAFDWKTGAVCKAEFSFGKRGCNCNAPPRRDYILDILEDRTNVTVKIGALFDDEIGVELHGDAGSELECGRRYVFRAYALATTNGIERQCVHDKPRGCHEPMCGPNASAGQVAQTAPTGVAALCLFGRRRCGAGPLPDQW